MEHRETLSHKLDLQHLVDPFLYLESSWSILLMELFGVGKYIGSGYRVLLLYDRGLI